MIEIENLYNFSISITVNARPNFSTPQTRSYFAKFFSEEPNDMFGEVKQVAAKTDSIKQFCYVDYEVIAPEVKRLQYRGRTCQVPIIRGTSKVSQYSFW